MYVCIEPYQLHMYNTYIARYTLTNRCHIFLNIYLTFFSTFLTVFGIHLLLMSTVSSSFLHAMPFRLVYRTADIYISALSKMRESPEISDVRYTYISEWHNRKIQGAQKGMKGRSMGWGT